MKRILLVGLDPKAQALLRSMNIPDRALEIKNLRDFPVAIGSPGGDHYAWLEQIHFVGGQVVANFRGGTPTEGAGTVQAALRFFKGE